MKISKVKKLPVEERFLYWIGERETIRVKKERGEERPWTDDEILYSYRFCNVRRMDDSVSQWLLKNWYEPNYDHPNMLLAVALARFINRPRSLEQVTKLVFQGSWSPDTLVETLRYYRDRGNKVFNGAYMVRGNDGTDKIDCVINHYISSLLTKEGKPITIPVYSMREAHAAIFCRYGFGSFMAGQIVADLRWAKRGSWGDKNEWAAVGPGSSRGACRLYGESPTPNLPQEEFWGRLEWVSDFVEENLPKIRKRLEAIDLQNCLCEFDKYERTLQGDGRPKAKYGGT